jgi:hypothetical protein
MSLGKKLYCTFGDFSKAFDTITRSSLWVKLQKFLELFILYDNVKSFIKNNDKFSSFFRENSNNLSSRTEVKVLLRHDTNVIGLYELGSLVSPLFL